MSDEELERLLTWAWLSAPLRCDLLLPGDECGQYPQFWWQPGYRYPCGPCFRRREALRSVTG